MFADNDFYTDIKIELRALEDYLVKEGERVLSQEEQEKVWEITQIKLETIYKVFNCKYTGQS